MSQHLQTQACLSGCRGGIAQLFEACECAKDRRYDLWQFALNIDSLVALGMSESELRWLVSKGYAEHACETTTARDSARKFRPARNLAFAAKTCFVLTHAGAAYAATMLDAPGTGGESAVASEPAAASEQGTGPFLSVKTLSAHGRWGENADASAAVRTEPLRLIDRPQWDGDRRVLRVGPCVIKQYRLPSPNQAAILAAFQEEGWPHRIDDPLSPQADQDPKCRLHDTIKRLNRHHQERLLRFFGDGTGEGICWELVAAAVLPLPASAGPKKLRLAA